MTYLLKGWSGLEEQTIIETNDKDKAMIEWLSFKRDLEENPDELSGDERYDYILFTKHGKKIGEAFKIEECDRCGYYDVLVCHSNGCVYE